MTSQDNHEQRTPGAAVSFFPLTLASPFLLVLVVVLVTAIPAAAAPATSSASPARTIAVGSNPIALAISPGQSFAFVANDGSVSTVNLSTRKQVGEVGTGNVQDQSTIGLVRNGAKTYVGVYDRPTLTVMNTRSQTVAKTVTIGFGATGFAAAGGHAYIPLLRAKRVAVLETATDSLVARIKLPGSPQTAQTAPDGKSVWIGSASAGKVWVVDAETRKIVRTFSAQDSGPIQSIAFARNGRAWLSGLGGVSVLGTVSGKLLAFVPITRIFPGGPNAGPIALNPSNTVAMVVNSTFPDSNAGPGAVAFLDTKTLRVTRRITLGNEPTAMALDTRRGMTYVTNYKDDTLSYFATPK
jgi:DNA-binding beta-propeller fold protein YncE